MFFDDLPGDGGSDGIDACLELVYLIVAKPVKFIEHNPPYKLARSFDCRRILPLNVALGRLELFLGHTVLVKFFQDLQGKIDRGSCGFVFREAVNLERPGSFVGIKKGACTVAVTRLDPKSFIELGSESAAKNRVDHANWNAIR